MKKLLIVDVNQNNIEMLAINIRAHMEIQISVVEDSAQAAKLIKTENFDLIISREKIGAEGTLKRVIAAQISNKKSTPIVSLKENDDTSDDPYPKGIKIVSLKREDNLEEITTVTLKFLETGEEKLSALIVSEYFPIPTNHFFAIQQSVCDVYIKIGKLENVKFIKRIHTGDNLDKETVDRYISKGVSYLYIDSSNRGSFVQSLTQQVIKDLDEDKQKEVIKKAARQMSQELVSQHIKELGITEEIVQVSKKAINSLTKSINKKKSIGGMLDKLYANKLTYSYKLMELTTYFGLKVLDQTDWAKDSQKETLVFVAFFKDVALADNRLAQIGSEKELNEAELNPDERNLVLKHAQLSAQLTVRYPKAPLGAEVIIRQHHGSTNGHGFTDYCSPNLSPLSVIYIIAEDCARYVLKSKDPAKFSGKELINYIRGKYETARFSKYVDALVNLAE